MLTNSIFTEIKHQFRYGNMVVKLIFANLAVFLFFALFFLVSTLSQTVPAFNAIVQKFEIPASLSALLYQPWSVFTYMFLHRAILHILFNMLSLYWFGEIFVLYMGDKKILPLYILGGLGGAAIYLLAFNLIPFFNPQLNSSYMLGASAGIFAIVFASATINPEHELRLLIIGNVRIKYVALVLLLLDVINIPYSNAGGYLAHVGGAITGYVFIKALQSGYNVAAPFTWLAGLFKPKSKLKVTYKSVNEKPNTAKKSDLTEQQKVDDILDKIARSGYDSLSKQEKDFLFHFSNK